MMQRFAFILLLALSGASAESTSSLQQTTSNNYAASHQRRELSFSSMWYTLLNHLHIPCPPHESGHQKGHCAHTSHKSGGGGSGSSSGGSGSGGGSSSASSSSSGGGGGSSSSSSSGSGGGGDSSSASGSSSGGGGGWSDDGYGGGGNGNSNENGNDDAYEISADDQWSSDGWESSNLGNGKGNNGASKVGIKAENIAPFVIGALFAGLIGAAFVVTRKRRQEQDEAHPLEGSLKKRMKLFAGGVFRPKKKGMLNDDLEEGNDGGSGTPAFVEISSVKSSGAASVTSGAGGSYAPPRSVIEGFENESDDSDDDM